MSRSCDDPDEMRRPDEPDDRTAESILRGHTAALEGDDRVLAEALSSLRVEAHVQPQPSPELLQVFAEGTGAQEARTAEPSAGPVPATAGPLLRGGSGLRRRLARVAGLSLGAKLALAGAAAAAAAGGAGAAGMMPGQVQDPPPTEPAEEAEADFGREIADEAADREGMDGQDVADRARQLRGEHGTEADPPGVEHGDETGQEAREQGGENGDRGLQEADEHTEQAPESVPQSGDEGRDRAEEQTADAPAEQRSDDSRAPEDVPGAPDVVQQQADRDDGTDEAPARRDDDQRRDTSRRP
jgi:hypothetical protein